MIKTKKRVTIFLLLLMLFPSPASATDGSGWQIVAQLTQLLATANETLANFKEQIDLVNVLASRDESSFIKKVSKLGSDFIDLSNEIGTTRKLINSFEDDPFGTEQMQSDVDYFTEQIKAECTDEEKERCLRKKGAALASLNRMKWLAGSAKKSLTENKDVDGATRDTSNNTAALVLIWSDFYQNHILNQEEEARQEEMETRASIRSDLNRSSYLTNFHRHR